MADSSGQEQDVVEISPPREMTPSERRLIQFLLSRPFPGRDELRRQADRARVCGEGALGGPTLVLCVEPSSSLRAPVKRRIPVEARGRDSDGVGIEVLLHVVDGLISELEVFREDSRPTKLPQPESLELFFLDE